MDIPRRQPVSDPGRFLLLVSSFDSSLYLRYEGFFVDGKKHGQGIYFYSDGSQYDGKLTVRNKEVINQLDAFYSQKGLGRMINDMERE